MYELNNNINGKGKEYDIDGKLIFESEYLNGEKNGKGKEYNHNCKLLYEGEYYNDLKWKGKGYDLYKNIIYELKDGKGLVKEYHKFIDNIIFEGEYLNSRRNGKGKEYDKYNGELKFEGEYLNGKRIGKGKEYNNSKLIFEGEYFIILD